MFVLLERRSGDVSSILWRVRGTLVSWANSSVGIQSCPIPPRRSAVRPEPTRPWYVPVLESTGINRMQELNPWLTTGLSAVYPRDRERFFSLAADQWIDAFVSLNPSFMQGMSGKSCRIQNLDIPRVGSGRGARRGGRAGSGRIRRQQNCSPRKQRILITSKASKKRRLNVSLEARASEILCKPNAGAKSAVDNRFIRGLFAGSRALFLPG